MVLKMKTHLVRVKPEVEDLVKVVARRYGYLRFTVRNTAILYGLAMITLSGGIPESDRDFEKLLKRVRGIIGE